MPLTREKKEQVVTEVEDLLSKSKMTVVASYRGTSVKAMQALRRQARDNGTTVKVIKNRLVIQALSKHQAYKEIDTGIFGGMLAYAFNPDDEVAPAQSLAEFAKTYPTLEFVGALSADGSWLDADKVKALAALPNKPTLIGSVITLLGSPIRSVVRASSAQLPLIIQSLQAKVNE